MGGGGGGCESVVPYKIPAPKLPLSDSVKLGQLACSIGIGPGRHRPCCPQSLNARSLVGGIAVNSRLWFREYDDAAHTMSKPH